MKKNEARQSVANAFGNKNTQEKWRGQAEYAAWLAGILLGMLCALFLALDRLTPFSNLLLQNSCWIHRLSGLYCPGCGGTRAFLAALHGKWLSSFLLHPFVLCAGVFYAVFMARGVIAVASHGRYPFMKLRLWHLYAGIAVILVQFAVKNIALLAFHVTWL